MTEPILQTGLEIASNTTDRISPMRVYTAKEVASFLGVSRVQSIYEIPEDELPRSRRVGATYGYLGINVLAYIAGVEPVDVAAAVEEYRVRLLSDRPPVQPLGASDGEKLRIL